MLKNYFLLASWRSMTKIAGSGSRIRIRIRIHQSEAWIRGSGSGSTPKYHGSATLSESQHLNPELYERNEDSVTMVRNKTQIGSQEYKNRLREVILIWRCNSLSARTFLAGCRWNKSLPFFLTVAFVCLTVSSIILCPGLKVWRTLYQPDFLNKYNRKAVKTAAGWRLTNRKFTVSDEWKAAYLFSIIQKRH